MANSSPIVTDVNFNECWQLVLLIKSLDSFLSARRRPRREQAWTHFQMDTSETTWARGEETEHKLD